MQSDISGMKNDISGMKNDISGMKNDIDTLKKGQERIENKLDGVVEQTADLTEFKTYVLSKLEELNEVEEATKTNCYDIAKLKSIK